METKGKQKGNMETKNTLWQYLDKEHLDINNESDLTDIRITDLNAPSEPPVEILGQD